METTEGGPREKKKECTSHYDLHSIFYISHDLCVYNRACDEDIISTTSGLFYRKLIRGTRYPHIQQWHSFIRLPMQMLQVTVKAGWLQCSIAAWHERFSVGVCSTGTHIMALWARQPLSNYCEPSQALLRHALNFAQDRWGPAEYAAESSVPTANHCRLRG